MLNGTSLSVIYSRDTSMYSQHVLYEETKVQRNTINFLRSHWQMRIQPGLERTFSSGLQGCLPPQDTNPARIFHQDDTSASDRRNPLPAGVGRCVSNGAHSCFSLGIQLGVGKVLPRSGV